MLPKAHMTSHSRMSGSRWVITPSWSWSSFLYSSSMYFSKDAHTIPPPSNHPGSTGAAPRHDSAALHMPANLENSAVAPGLEKVSFHYNPKERQCQRMLKLPHNCTSKFSKPGFSNMWTVNFLIFKLVLEKTEEPEIKLPTSAGSRKKQESSRKTSISALLTMPKPWLCG